MFCSKCGKQINGDSKFCAYCGSEIIVNENIVDESSVQMLSDEPSLTNNEPITNEDSEKINDNEQPVSKKKRKCKKGIIFSCVAAVVVISVALTLFFPSVSNFLRKTFTSSESYYHHVEEVSADETTKSIVSAISMYRNSYKNPQAGNFNFSWKLSPELLNTLSNEGGAEITSILQLFSNGKISGSVYGDKNISSNNFGISLNGKDFVSAEMIVDSNNEAYFIKIPEMSDKYIELPYQIDKESAVSSLALDRLDKIISALPEEEKLEKLLNEYLSAIINCIDEVKESSKTINVEGVSENCTVYTVKITEDVAENIAETILKKAKKDKELESILKDFFIAIDPEADADDFYDSFQEGIDDFLDEINADDDDDDDYDDYDEIESIKIKSYVNSKGEIVGRSIIVEETELSYFMPKDGNDFGLKVTLKADGEEISVIGKGNTKKDKINGDFEIIYGEAKLLTLKVTDFKPSTEDDNSLSGKLELSFSKQLTSLMNLADNNADFNLEALSVVIELNSNDIKSEIKLQILYNGIEYALFSVESNVVENKQVISPNFNDCYDDTNDWLKTVDVDRFKSALKNIGLQDELVDNLIYSLNIAINGYDYDYDYDYGYDYDYDYDYDYGYDYDESELW